MSTKVWRILVIDDNPEMTFDAKREIEYTFTEGAEINVIVDVENNFDKGYERVRKGECDIVILDVRRDGSEEYEEDDEAGRRVFSRIQKIRFLPVIFWTALPRQVADQEMKPLVSVFSKDELHRIPDAIRMAIASKSVEVMTGIEETVADIMRKHMWQELAPHWEEDTSGGQAEELARILITRVAQSLQDQDFPELTAKPSHCYLYPPVSEKVRPGDLLRNNLPDGEEWWSVLTPACDLEIAGKADFVLLARASPLTQFAKFKKWSNNQNPDNWRSLATVLKGSIHRYHYLPAFREIPELLLDLENVQSVAMSKLSELERVASIVSPYSEALLVRNSHFRGRIGVPNLNIDYVKERLMQSES